MFWPLDPIKQIYNARNAAAGQCRRSRKWKLLNLRMGQHGLSKLQASWKAAMCGLARAVNTHVQPGLPWRHSRWYYVHWVNAGRQGLMPGKSLVQVNQALWREKRVREAELAHVRIDTAKIRLETGVISPLYSLVKQIDPTKPCSFSYQLNLLFQGDSGGPAICDGRVHGIVMGGLYCAKADYPGVYTRVAHYVPWIIQTIQS